MACNVDHAKEKVNFLYKLKEGGCSNSFGINVAKVIFIFLINFNIINLIQKFVIN
jgi:DNA mismatch repair ATPase MutS